MSYKLRDEHDRAERAVSEAARLGFTDGAMDAVVMRAQSLLARRRPGAMMTLPSVTGLRPTRTQLSVSLR